MRQGDQSSSSIGPGSSYNKHAGVLPGTDMETFDWHSGIMGEPLIGESRRREVMSGTSQLAVLTDALYHLCAQMRRKQVSDSVFNSVLKNEIMDSLSSPA